MNRTRKYVIDDTRPFSAAERAELAAAVDVVDDLAARTHRPGAITLAEIIAELGIDTVRARCRQLAAEGHRDAADAIRAELLDRRPPQHRRRHEHRLAKWFTCAVLTAVDLATHRSAAGGEGART